MEIFRGIPVFPGLVMGPALILDPFDLPVARTRISKQSVEAEILRFEEAAERLGREIAEDERAARDRFGNEIAMIFQAQKMMVADQKLHETVAQQITRDLVSAETSARRALQEYIRFFRSLRNSPLADRAADLIDIERRLIAQLTQQQSAESPDSNETGIILARDLSPSQTASLDARRVLGFGTATGGRTSHTAILAGAMEIPAVVGLGDFLSTVHNGDSVILDATEGCLIVRPDPTTIERYKRAQSQQLRIEAELLSDRGLPSVTLDGEEVEVFANIEFPHEAQHALDMGAAGIGLYRTEFLHLHCVEPPTEEDHFQAYQSVLEVMGPDRPVTVRTLDLGADKIFDRPVSEQENNPVLGLRSIRLSLREVGLFKRQLRALLRASVFGNLRIMFPLVTTVMELRRCRLILADVMEDLEEEKIPFKRNIPIGMMVEVPAAALLAEQFSKLVDFFSIGTNDLIQYTLAADRTNENLATLYSASDPAVLKLLREVVKVARKQHVELSICGEMSGEPIYTPLLFGMGLRQLSVTPHKIPEVKRVVRGLTRAEALRLCGRVNRLDNSRDITSILRDRLRKISPEHAHDLE
ncbi:phosphoenolpyruvate--protein phosphotransferase [bacterium]|nr:phosphoenolpyruvate--protein phosphotransferase [bacterium]